MMLLMLYIFFVCKSARFKYILLSYTEKQMLRQQRKRKKTAV